MTKKYLSVILLFFFVVTSSGVVVSLHYCGNKLVKYGLWKEAKPCCKKGVKSGCCKNETVVVKIEDRFFANGSPEIKVQDVTPLFLPYVPGEIHAMGTGCGFGHFPGFIVPPDLSSRSAPEFSGVFRI